MSQIVDENPVQPNNAGANLGSPDTGMDNLSGVPNDGSQFLTFRLQQEEFGVEILRVQEIKGISNITPIPNMPHYIKGVINLRGTVVPIVDLRAKFGMPENNYDQFTVTIVVTIGEKVTGLVVDAVSDVLNVSQENIEPVSDLGVDADTSFMSGIAKSGERLITLLNLEKLISLESLGQPLNATG